jgi:propanol-preferring alcohol dehydrogenase
VFALHAAGRTRVIFGTRPLDWINTAIEDVLQGQAPARIVLTP